MGGVCSDRAGVVANAGADLVEVGDLLRSPRSGSLYRVIFIDPNVEGPPVAVVECGGLGAPLMNAPVRYVYPERFEREH